MSVDYGNARVCVDCYFAHHYGATKVEREATEHEALYHGGLALAAGFQFDGLEFAETPEGLMVTEWFAGDSDTRCYSGEPLRLLEGLEIWDNTCSNHELTPTGELDEDENDVLRCEHCGSDDDEDGIEEFSRSACDGCGSHLGGSRYRLHLTKEE